MPRVPAVAGGLCTCEAQPACAGHWDAFTERTLTLALLGLCSAGQAHLGVMIQWLSISTPTAFDVCAGLLYSWLLFSLTRAYNLRWRPVLDL